MATHSTHHDASMMRIILGSFLSAFLAYFHFNFLLQGNGAGWLILLVFGLCLWKSKALKTKDAVKHFHFKTASILSFLLPVSAMVYSFVLTGMAVEGAGSEAEQVGSAIGGLIGGGIMVGLSFVIGLSLGITFYILSRKKK